MYIVFILRKYLLLLFDWVILQSHRSNEVDKPGGFRVYGDGLTGRFNKQVDYRKETKYSTQHAVQSNAVKGLRSD